MKIQTTKIVESQVYPGVSFCVKIMQQGVKDRLRRELAVPLTQLMDLQAQLEDRFADVPRHACTEACEKPCKKVGSFDENHKVTAKDMSDIIKLQTEAEGIKQLQIDPVWLKACFVSISGVEIEGVEGPITAQHLQDFAPPDLYAEIIAVIRDEAELKPEEKQNLESPTTSPAPVDGQTSDSNAGNASAPSSI